MPGMDGLQLLGEIKRHFPNLPVMMVTAYGDDERRRRAREFGATKRRRDGTEADFRPALKVATHDLGEGVEIRIRDNGTGIPLEIKDKLFQPFFTTKPTGEGTGLGLSISWDIVTQQHGGTIEVDSRVGEYTEFTIRLPRDRHAATSASTA